MKYSSCADRIFQVISLCDNGRFIRLVDGHAGAQSLSSDHHKVRAVVVDLSDPPNRPERRAP